METDGRPVRLFGHEPPSGYSFMDGVRDRATGKWLHWPPDPQTLWEEQQARKYGADVTGAAMTAAVIDTGLVRQHPLIKGRILAEVDCTGGDNPEDESGHGTITALHLPPKARLLNVKVAHGDERDDSAEAEAHLIRGLEWVADYARRNPGAIIANISVGVYGRRLFGLLSCDGTCGVCEAAYRASKAGVLVCAAAGNTPGTTACPAMQAFSKRNASVVAVTCASGQYGIGNVATRANAVRIPRILE